MLDQILQTYSTPTLGPLWVSTGEGFSPKGVYDFLNILIAYTETQTKKARHYKQELIQQTAKHKSTIVTVRSMSKKELKELIAVVSIKYISNMMQYIIYIKLKIMY